MATITDVNRESKGNVVLIGSRALSYHGYEGDITDSDYDFLVSGPGLQFLQRMCSVVKVKDNMHMLSMGKDTAFDVTVVTENCDNSLRLVFDRCVADAELNVTLDIESDDNKRVVRCALCPLDLLYALKKSHIHRVLDLCGSKKKNVELWNRHMKMYNWMREKLGYTRMDDCIYHVKVVAGCIKPMYLNPKDPTKQPDESEGDFLVRSVFLSGFDETNKRSGDALPLLEMTQEKFFTDNVPRHVPHDQLHEHVSMMYRETKQNLFDRFKLKKEDTDMDQLMFLSGTFADQIQTLIEEVTVLLLERKIIPLLVEYSKSSLVFHKFDDKQLAEWFLDACSHFVTNLCGSGHYWLRRFCLDHYYMISDMEMYRLASVVKIGVKLSEVVTTQKKIGESFVEFAKDVKGNYNRLRCVQDLPLTYMLNPTEALEFIRGRPSLNRILSIKKNWKKRLESFVTFMCTSKSYTPLDLYPGKEETTIFIVYYNGTDNMDPATKVDMKIEAVGPELFINSNGVGFHTDGVKLSFFYIDDNAERGERYYYSQSSHKTLGIKGKLFELQDDKVPTTADARCEFSATKEIVTRYYFSRDNSCGHRNQHEAGEKVEMSTYGYDPLPFNYLEETAKRFFGVDVLEGVIKDEIRPMRSWEVDDEYAPDYPVRDDDDPW